MTAIKIKLLLFQVFIKRSSFKKTVARETFLINLIWRKWKTSDYLPTQKDRKKKILMIVSWLRKFPALIYGSCNNVFRGERVTEWGLINSPQLGGYASLMFTCYTSHRANKGLKSKVPWGSFVRICRQYLTAIEVVFVFWNCSLLVAEVLLRTDSQYDGEIYQKSMIRKWSFMLN